jgi:hypothetical protein
MHVDEARQYERIADINLRRPAEAGNTPGAFRNGDNLPVTHPNPAAHRLLGRAVRHRRNPTSYHQLAHKARTLR